MPIDAVHVAPRSAEKETGALLGLQTTRPPSAAAAIMPPLAPAGAVAAGVHVVPPSVEKPTGLSEPDGLPARTTKLAMRPAKSRLVPVLNVGVVNISCGVLVRSSWRKPPMSPRALSRCAPAGGLIT